MKKFVDKCKTGGSNMSCIYLLGFIGAAIYFIGQAATFGAGVVGFLKALVWPVFLVLQAFESFNMPV